MNSSHSKFTVSQILTTILLGCVLLIGNITAVLYSVLRIQQSALSLLLYSLLIGGILALWAYNDSRSKVASIGLDQAFFICFAWPIIFPLYVFTSRSLRSGCLLLLFFLGLYLITLIPAILIIIVIATSRVIHPSPGELGITCTFLYYVRQLQS